MKSDTLRIYWATLRAQLKQMSRYRMNFVFAMINSVLFVLVMLLFVPFYSQSVQNEIGTHYIFSYVILGAIFATLTDMMWEARYIIQEELDFGSIDYVFSSPISRYKYFLGLSMASGTIELLFNAPIFVLAVVLAWKNVSIIGILSGFLSIVVALMTLLFLGECIGSLVLIYRRIGGITGIIGTASTFLSGSFVPVAIFPKTLQYISFIFPQTSSLYLARYYLLGSTVIIPIYVAWAIMFGELLLFGFLAWVSIRFAENVGKIEGFHHI